MDEWVVGEWMIMEGGEVRFLGGSRVNSCFVGFMEVVEYIRDVVHDRGEGGDMGTTFWSTMCVGGICACK